MNGRPSAAETRRASEPSVASGGAAAIADPGGRYHVLAIVAVALGVAALLAIFVDRDPTFGVTASASPFADEGFNALNARNFVLLGRWSTDGWNLHLVNLPFSLALAAVFEVFGVGIVQARLAAITMVAVSVLILGLGLRRSFGGWPAALAAVAFGTSSLVLFYGRLVYLEDLVSLFLVVGVIAICSARSGHAAWGVIAGLGFALAIATKPSAMFATGGAILALALFGAGRDPHLRRRLAVAVAVVIVAGLAWLLFVALPNVSAIRDDLRIWAPITWPTDPHELVRRVRDYLGSNDRAVYYAAPLILGAAAGGVLLLRNRRALTGDQRALCLAALGLITAGLAVLAVASYRPSRYVVPLLPGFAILVGAGWSVGLARLRRLLRPGAVRLVSLIVLVALAGPGVAAHLGWMARASSTLPGIQAEMARLLPDGATVVGPDAPTMAMRAPAVAIVPVPGVSQNSGPLYDTANARWFMTNPGSRPSLVTLPPGVWEARREAGCVSWFRSTICLYGVR